MNLSFVSTNSIAQGEQVGVLWNELFTKYNVEILFAHRTFRWDNEAKGKAAVHVVIISFGNDKNYKKRLFDYQDITGEAQELSAKNINPYLVQGGDFIIQKRSKQICGYPKMNYGSMPIDNGFLIMSNDEKEEAIKTEPFIESCIRRYTGGYEFINNVNRWCLWLVDTDPKIIHKSKIISHRISETLKFRKESNRAATNKLASYPSLFGEIRQPKSSYLIVPKVSSESRKYIPIGINPQNIIASGSSLIIPNADLFIFGIITSEMHMIWMAYTCGRMKSDFQYSTSIVYNNYPFPKEVSEKNRQKVEETAQKVLDIRLEFPDSSLADLYDPLAMPPKLVKAHQALDKAVDLCYRPQAFVSERNRIEFLFDLYEQYTAPLMVLDKKKKRK
jgi:hypothetical protein